MYLIHSSVCLPHFREEELPAQSLLTAQVFQFQYLPWDFFLHMFQLYDILPIAILHVVSPTYCTVPVLHALTNEGKLVKHLLHHPIYLHHHVQELCTCTPQSLCSTILQSQNSPEAYPDLSHQKCITFTCQSYMLSATPCPTFPSSLYTMPPIGNNANCILTQILNHILHHLFTLFALYNIVMYCMMCQESMQNHFFSPTISQ